MEFNILICVFCFVAYIQAKSTYSHQDAANDIIENFKIKDVEKVTENLQNIIDKLKDIKHNYLDYSKEEFKKKSQNALDMLMKMPKKCTPKKAEQVQQISMNGIWKFTSCQNFTDALHTAEDLLEEAEKVASTVIAYFAFIEGEINNCTKESPFLVVFCLSKQMDNILKEIDKVRQTVIDFVEYAEQDLESIMSDILSCFGQASKETDDKMALLFEELKQCATSNHND